MFYVENGIYYMKTHDEPSTFFFDKKSASYYKNQSLNNCKSRSRYIIKLHNALINCKSIIDQIVNLEKNKDFYTKESNIKDIENSINNAFNSLEEYNTYLESEMQDLLSRDYEKIVEDNVSKIRNEENEKECEEIYK